MFSLLQVSSTQLATTKDWYLVQIRSKPHKLINYKQLTRVIIL
jgi:hypothetical protein